MALAERLRQEEGPADPVAGRNLRVRPNTSTSTDKIKDRDGKHQKGTTGPGTDQHGTVTAADNDGQRPATGHSRAIATGQQRSPTAHSGRVGAQVRPSTGL
jgi:hypothetical protein